MRVVLWKFFVLAAFLPGLGWGKEIFHLSNGFDLIAESHSLNGDHILISTGTGSLEVLETQVIGIEPLPPEPAKSVVASRASTIPAVDSVIDVLRRAAHEEGNSPEFARLVRSIAMAESSLRQDAISPKGAIGIMQLMPSTAKALGVKATDLKENAKGGAQLLANLLEKYRYDSVQAIAAYNAGTEAVRRYGGLPPYPETQSYVRRVLQIYTALSKAEKAADSASVH